MDPSDYTVYMSRNRPIVDCNICKGARSVAVVIVRGLHFRFRIGYRDVHLFTVCTIYNRHSTHDWSKFVVLPTLPSLTMLYHSLSSNSRIDLSIYWSMSCTHRHARSVSSLFQIPLPVGWVGSTKSALLQFPVCNSSTPRQTVYVREWRQLYRSATEREAQWTK